MSLTTKIVIEMNDNNDEKESKNNKLVLMISLLLIPPAVGLALALMRYLIR